MSKKFLTVFALVALLVAAMAGAAFADGGDITVVEASGDVNNIDEISDTSGSGIANAYFVSIDGKPDIVFTVAYTVAQDGSETYIISSDGTIDNGTGTGADGTISVISSGPTATGSGTEKIDATFTLSGWTADSDGEIKIDAIKAYKVSDNTAVGAGVDIVLTMKELIVSADAETVTATEGVATPPGDVEFDVFDDADTTLGVTISFANATVSADGMESGLIFNKVDAIDYLSADVAGIKLSFGTGSYGPGAVGNTKLAFVADSISFDISTNEIVYVAGVAQSKTLTEVSVDVAAGALKSTGDIAFTLEEASAPKTIKVSSDQALSVVEFWVVSDDAGTLKKIASGEEVKSLTFTFDDVEANSVDFVVAFDEAYDGVSHDVAVVASSDKGKTKFTVKVNDPASTPPGGHGDNVYSNTDAVSKDLAAKGIHVIDEATYQSIHDSFEHSLYSNAEFAADPDAVAIGGSLIVSLDVNGGKNAVPMTYKDSLLNLTAAASSADLLTRSFDIRYAYVDFANPTSHDVDILIGDNSVLGLSWKEAISDDVVKVTGPAIEVNYIVVDGDKPAERLGKYIIIYDGRGNGHIYDPMYVVERASRGGHSSSSGCDMGFGAFALLGLAGAAALLRRKD